MALYTGENANPAHSLHYSWTGWTEEDSRMPAIPQDVIAGLANDWTTDDLTLVSHACTRDSVQFTMSTPPHVVPAVLAARVKGRLQYVLRRAGEPTTFSRKLAVRSLGENRRATVERYIRDQLLHVDLCDPRMHIAVRGGVESSPAEIAVAIQNETARAALGCRVWRDQFYVGTFSEYDLDAVRD
ncbi:MAG: hypothetical protein V1929_07950 [bacterium]